MSQNISYEFWILHGGFATVRNIWKKMIKEDISMSCKWDLLDSWKKLLDTAWNDLWTRREMELVPKSAAPFIARKREDVEKMLDCLD